MLRAFLNGILLLALAACSGGQAGVRIHDAWIRLLPGERPSAGYFALENRTDHSITLTGAATDAFSGAMFHQSADGTMRHVSSLDVPAGGQLRFAPGGYHIMFMPPHEPLQMGDQVKVSLEFAGGFTRAVEFVVQGPAATSAQTQ